MDDSGEDHLQACREVVEHLQEETQELQHQNEVLRESAESFGDLAERLSTALKDVRDP